MAYSSKVYVVMTNWQEMNKWSCDFFLEISSEKERPRGELSTRHVHEAHNLHIAVGRKMVAFGLEGQGFDDSFLQGVDIAGMTAQYGTQIDGVFIAQAEQQPALDGHPDPIAGRTEVVAVR